MSREVQVIAAALIPGSHHDILSERDEIRQQFLAAFGGFVPPPVSSAAFQRPG
jgi:hypothetical protein